MKASTPVTPRAKKRAAARAEGVVAEARVFGRSTIVTTARVKQIKIGSLFVSPIGAVKRTQTPEKNLSNQKSRPKTPSKMRPSTAKKKLDVDGAAGAEDGPEAAGATEEAGAKADARPSSVSYPSPSSSRSSSRENRAAHRHPKKAGAAHGAATLSANNGASTNNDLDDVDLFAKIKEQRQRTEHLLQSVNLARSSKSKKAARRI